MSGLSRRRLIVNGLWAAASVSGVGAMIHVAGRNGLIPPDHTGLFGVGETLTYAAQRVVAGDLALAREFSRNDISKVIPVNGPPPETDTYQRLLDTEFRDWRLQVDGLVARPRSFSLSDLKAYPAHTQSPTKRARKDGRSSRNGPASGCRTCSNWSVSMPERATSCSFPSISSGRASTCPTRSIRRRSSLTA